MTTKTERIRALNDQLRQLRIGGTIVVTDGVASLGTEAVERIFHGIAAFDDFEEGNDPYGIRDFGALDAEGQRLFFKIDYYDQSLSYGSPDPADAAVTRRVLTVMLAEEY
jgi:hypothetical protein